MLNVHVSMQFEDLLNVVEQLSDEQKHILLERLAGEQPTAETVQKTRIPDLFPGIWMSEDFDEPLPDEFWFGEDA